MSNTHDDIHKNKEDTIDNKVHWNRSKFKENHHHKNDH